MGQILVIEDEEHNRFLLCKILEAAGHTVIEAGDGTEALNLLKTRFDPISLIVLDIRLPKMDGFEFLARLRQEEKARLPVLVLTAHQNLCARAEEFGARGCLIKPFKRKVLLDTVDQFTAGV
jgi:CheY-like chemotaxis protein